MSCYRNGGCGPYEHRSCSDCPASKPEYLHEKGETKRREVKLPGVTITRPLGMLTPIHKKWLSDDNGDAAIKSVVMEWLTAHKNTNDSYAVCMKPEFIIDNMTQAGMSNKNQDALRQFMASTDTTPLHEKLRHHVEETRTYYRRIYPNRHIGIITPLDTNGHMLLTGDLTVNTASKDRLIYTNLYDIVLQFDNLCETIFIELLKAFQHPNMTGKHPEKASDVQTDSDKFAAFLMQIKSYTDIKRPDLVNMLITSGYEPSVIAHTMGKI